MSVAGGEHHNNLHLLKGEIERIADQLCYTVDGDFNLHIDTEFADESLQKLVLLVNFVLGNARRSVGLLEELNRDLDTLAQRRTSELSHAKNIAEGASQAKSDFLSQMSHELRTPLNSVIGFAQLLLDSEKDVLVSRQRKQVGHILNGGRHLLDLINEVLDLSKIESGNLVLNMEAVDPRLLILDSLQMIDPLIEKFGIVFENRIPTDMQMPPVMCDYMRAKQCLINLLNNAFKYNKPGGLAWVETRVFEGERIRFIVGDTGEGIPESKYHELFKTFSRLGREQTDVEGTGVGLALTRLMVQAMGGVIDFESREDEGSSFWFDLPISTEAAPAAEPEVLPVIELSDRPVGIMLYVEDSPSNVSLMRDILDEYTDVTLLTAPSAETAIEYAIVYKPDIIVMDMNLPGMNGVDAARYMKSLPETRAITLFAVSTDVRNETQKRAEAAGIERFFTKPINVSEFIRALNALFSMKQKEATR